AILLAPDTRQGALTQAYDTRLDRVSLQSRVVLAMLPLDPDRALELFELIDVYLESASCEDPLIPIADEYYNALTQIARDMPRAGISPLSRRTAHRTAVRRQRHRRPDRRRVQCGPEASGRRGARPRPDCRQGDEAVEDAPVRPDRVVLAPGRRAAPPRAAGTPA